VVAVGEPVLGPYGLGDRSNTGIVGWGPVQRLCVYRAFRPSSRTKTSKRICNFRSEFKL